MQGPRWVLGTRIRGRLTTHQRCYRNPSALSTLTGGVQLQVTVPGAHAGALTGLQATPYPQK